MRMLVRAENENENENENVEEEEEEDDIKCVYGCSRSALRQRFGATSQRAARFA